MPDLSPSEVLKNVFRAQKNIFFVFDHTHARFTTLSIQFDTIIREAQEKYDQVLRSQEILRSQYLEVLESYLEEHKPNLVKKLKNYRRTSAALKKAEESLNEDLSRVKFGRYGLLGTIVFGALFVFTLFLMSASSPLSAGVGIGFLLLLICAAMGTLLSFMARS